jgi:hypothetical protein
MDTLSQRASGLFLFTPAPEQRGKLWPQNRLRTRHRQNCQKRPGFARPGQIASALRIIDSHVAEQTHAQHHRVIEDGLRVLGM